MTESEKLLLKEAVIEVLQGNIEIYLNEGNIVRISPEDVAERIVNLVVSKNIEKSLKKPDPKG